MKLPLFQAFAVGMMAVLANAALASLPYGAGRIFAPKVIVAPDQSDWTYELGEEVTFTVQVLSDNLPIPGVKVLYSVGPEKFEEAGKEAVLPEGGLTISAGTMSEPGFLRCRVKAEIDGQTYEAHATVGFAPEQIQPTQVNPGDFDAFWKERLDELAQVPLRINKTLVPEQSTAEANVYHVSFQTWGGWSPDNFYGMLTVPATEGKYPAVLKVPGAGVRPYNGDTSLASKGALVFEIGIHGIPVNLPRQVYEDLRTGALQNYPEYQLDNPRSYYYTRVYLACVRALDVLTTNELWDGETLVVAGGSQGGQLSIVTSALDPRVTATVSNYPAYCDVTGYLHGRAGGWPHMFQSERNRTEEKLRTSSYFDVVNFARRLRAPISLSWGYNDTVCPPTSMHAAYNVITAPKELSLHLEMDHGPSAEFNRAYWNRVLKAAGLE